MRIKMGSHLKLIQEKQRKRYQLLLKLWEATGGRELVEVSFSDIAQESGLSEEEAMEIYIYFMEEHLFGYRGVDGNRRVTLSHKAIVEVEQSIAHPDEGTEHFSSTVIQNFNAPVGSVHTGPNSTSYVSQNFGANTSEVLSLIRELRNTFQSLPPDQKTEAIEVIDALEEEIQSPTPRKGRIKAFLGQIGSFTANTASNVIASAIAKSLGIGT
jgi:hypothetical protein